MNIISHRQDMRMAGLLGLASAGLLTGAYLFEYVGKLPPCEMCLWQRVPHWLIIGLCLIAFLTRRARLLLPLMLLVMLGSAGLGLFHAGVEQHWWQGPAHCTGYNIPTDITAIVAAPIVRCDVPAWSLFGISMAGYNALLSLLVALFILWQWRKST